MAPEPVIVHPVDTSASMLAASNVSLETVFIPKTFLLRCEKRESKKRRYPVNSILLGKPLGALCYKTLWLVATIIVFLTGIIGGLANSEPPSNSSEPKIVTFNQNVGPIIYKHCSGCHHSGEGTPFSLTNFTETKKRAQLIAAVTERRIMPPWHASPADVEFKGKRTLTNTEINLIQRWIEQGKKEGDLPAPELPELNEGWQYGTPDLVIQMPKPFIVPKDGPDIYRSFAIPLNLPDDVWVQAIEFRAGARAVVHHCFFFLDPSGKSHLIKHPDGQPGFTNMPIETWQNSLGGWNFGGDPVSVPESMAYRLPKGADFILQTHFHPSGKTESEVSTVGIYFAKQPPKRKFTSLMIPPVFGALADIDIPPESDNATAEDTFVLPIDVDAFGVTAHAHYLGKEVTMTAEFPSGKKMTLLQIDDWDFGWQEQYTFEEFVRLPKGTRLHAVVRYDNTSNNPFNPSDPPVRIRWGRDSEDEMGSITLMVSPVNNTDLSLLDDSYRDMLDDRIMDQIFTSKGKLIQTIFRRMDRNKNGTFEPEERARIRKFLKGNGFWPTLPGFSPKND